MNEAMCAVDQESIDKHAGALEEKEKIIQQLQTALQQRDETIKVSLHLAQG